MNKIVTMLLGSLLFSMVGPLHAFNSVSEDCKSENTYNDEACPGIEEKRQFFDKWYKPPAPFYYTTIDSTSLPDPSWISPNFDPNAMEEDFSGETSGETTESETTSECPPSCE